jgi:hypothetical protein
MILCNAEATAVAHLKFRYITAKTLTYLERQFGVANAVGEISKSPFWWPSSTCNPICCGG